MEIGRTHLYPYSISLSWCKSATIRDATLPTAAHALLGLHPLFICVMKQWCYLVQASFDLSILLLPPEQVSRGRATVAPLIPL